MARKRLIIEMGMGIDQHGQEPTVAAARAVQNAITCSTYCLEVALLERSRSVVQL